MRSVRSVLSLRTLSSGTAPGENEANHMSNTQETKEARNAWVKMTSNQHLKNIWTHGSEVELTSAGASDYAPYGITVQMILESEVEMV